MVSIHNQYENSESGIIIQEFPDDTNETIQKKLPLHWAKTVNLYLMLPDIKNRFPGKIRF